MAILSIIGGGLLIVAGAVLCVLGMGILGDLGTDRGHRKAMMFFGVVAVFAGIGIIWKTRDDKTLKNLSEKSDEIHLNLIRMLFAKKSEQAMIDYCVQQGNEPDMAKLTIDTARMYIKENADKNLPAIITKLEEMKKAGQTRQEMEKHAMQQGIAEDTTKMLVNGFMDKP